MQVMVLQESEPGFRIKLCLYPPDSIVELNTAVVSDVIASDDWKIYATISSFLVSRFGIGCKNVLCHSSRGISSVPSFCNQRIDNYV